MRRRGVDPQAVALAEVDDRALGGRRVEQAAVLRLAADRQVLGHGQRREQHEVLVDHRDAQPVGGLDVADGDRAGPATAMLPASGCWTPARICMSVVLPAPFSPTTAWTSPRAKVDVHAAERDDAVEALDDAASCSANGVTGALARRRSRAARLIAWMQARGSSIRGPCARRARSAGRARRRRRGRCRLGEVVGHDDLARDDLRRQRRGPRPGPPGAG